jgi:hypothetical protein
VNEQTGGVEYLFYIRELAKRVETDWDSIKADLKELQQLVLSVQVRSPPPMLHDQRKLGAGASGLVTKSNGKC